METICDKVNILWKNGKTYREISKELNITKNSIHYHLTSKGRAANERKKKMAKANEIFTEELKKVLPECNSFNEVCTRLGLKGVEGYYKKIKKIIRENNLDTSHFGTLQRKNYERGKNFKKIPTEEYFSEGVFHNGPNMLERLLKEGLKERKCEMCGGVEWNGTEIPLLIHHINGNNRDNRIENLQVLCPNCHAQTDTFGFSKKKREQIIKNVQSERKTQHKVLITKICHDLMDDSNLDDERHEMFGLFRKFKSFVQVGKYLGISDNAVRKRCKTLGILEEILKIKKEL